MSTNSCNNAYRLTEEVAEVLKAVGTTKFDKAVSTFIEQFGPLTAAYDRARAAHQIALRQRLGARHDGLRVKNGLGGG